MEKQLFIALGLHLWTERQLYWLICSVCQFDLLIMLLVMWRKNFFVEKSDISYFVVSIQMLAFVLFRVEHVTFFFSILYINLFLFAMYQICKYYSIKKKKDD
jgi:hypothetical protein